MVQCYKQPMNECRSNNNVVYSCKYHVIWCPKCWRKVLEPPIDARLKQIITEVCEETGAEVLEMEIMPDRVHMLVGCDPQSGIHRLVRAVKGRSLRLREEFPMLKSRLPSLWTNFYFVYSVDGAPLAVIK